MKIFLTNRFDLSTRFSSGPLPFSMQHFFFTLLLLTCFEVRAGHNRVWVGHRLEGMSEGNFIQGLNRIFFAETIAVGAGRGLQSYLPYITKMTPEVPDELALVVYESEEKYRAIRSTPEGQRYGELHWDYFQRSHSRSTVSEPFEGVLHEDRAFELRPTFTQWQRASTQVAIYARDSVRLTMLGSAFKTLARDPAVLNSILLVKGPWVIEYRALRGGGAFRPLPLRVLESKRLFRSSLRDLRETVGLSEGVNFTF